MTGPAVAVQLEPAVPMTPQKPRVIPQNRSLAKSMLVAPVPVCDPPLMTYNRQRNVNFGAFKIKIDKRGF